MTKTTLKQSNLASGRAKTILWVVIILIIIGGIWYGVSKKPVAEKEVIKIGAILPLTGSAAQFGIWKQEAIELALEEINKEGINNKRISVIYEDSAGDPTKGISAFRKLVDIDKVNIVISDISGVTLALLPLAKENDILVITSATHPSITQQDTMVLRNYFTPQQEATAMAKFAREKLNLQKVAILYLNDEAFLGYRNVFEEEFNSLDGQTYSESFEKDTTDFKTHLIKIKNWNPEAIYIGAWKEAGIILKQMKEIGINLQILGPITFDSPQLVSIAKEAAEEAIYTVPDFNIQSTKPLINSFVKKYRTRYDHNPEAISVIWYDTMYILKYALEKSSNPKEVYRFILEKKIFDGVMGTYQFEEDGNVKMPIIFKTIKNGEFVPYSE